MNAVAKRLRRSLYFTRPPQALSHPTDPTPAKRGALPEGRAPSVGFSHVSATQAYLRSVEETERDKPPRARGSAAVAGSHE